MVQTKHQVIIYWSNEDKVFIAEVPELPGSMARCRSKNEALTILAESV